MHKLENALTDYNQALRLDPEDSVAYYHRALIYKDQGDLKHYEADVRTSARLGFPPAQTLLAALEIQTKELSSAPVSQPHSAPVDQSVASPALRSLLASFMLN